MVTINLKKKHNPMSKSPELIELEEMLERQIKRRQKEIQVVGFASKKTTDQISRTRQLISLEKKKRYEPNE